MRKRLSGLAIAAVAFAFALGGATSASADTIIIDFSGQGGGTITESGGDFVGTGIAISSLQVTINGVLTTYDVSGSISDGCDLNGCASLDFDTAADTITITGDVEDLGINSEVVLLSGSFASFGTDPLLPGILSIFTAAGPDTKNPDLLSALGIPLDTVFNYGLFSIYLDATGAVTSSDVTNVSVPEPASMLMLGFGLFGSAGALRRRFSL
jgi:hypothetical protein